VRSECLKASNIEGVDPLTQGFFGGSQMREIVNATTNESQTRTLLHDISIVTIVQSD